MKRDGQTVQNDRSFEILRFTVITRLLYMFLLIPILHYVFIRYNYAIDESKSVFDIWKQMMSPRDAEFFSEIERDGYRYEILHVFFPLILYIKSKVRLLIPIEFTEIVIAMLIPLLMYKLTKIIFKAERFAYYCSLLFALNF
mmetsp:Transcript_30491/g.34916  ORF Transcript_30491/g.34916 Transcript_30491/m.34916 type:complete len:142 (-) Transcript_30491:3-428(-)